MASVEAASNLARYDGLKYGLSYDAAPDVETLTRRVRAEGFGAEAKRRIILGTYASSAGYAEKFYLKASAARAKIRAEFQSIFREVDLLISPIAPTTAWRIGEKVSDPMTMYLSDVFSVPAALAGVPAIVLPVGTDKAGLPLSVQITGPFGSDSLVLAAAQAIESLLGYHYKS